MHGENLKLKFSILNMYLENKLFTHIYKQIILLMNYNENKINPTSIVHGHAEKYSKFSFIYQNFILPTCRARPSTFSHISVVSYLIQHRHIFGAYLYYV